MKRQNWQPRRRDWQRAYGNVPQEFQARLRATLEGLEERPKAAAGKKARFPAAMLAAALVALLAGTAIAAANLGLFDFLNPIFPLEGAEKLVRTNLGTAENALVKMTVEEALFDGQGVLVQIRLTPKEPETCVLFSDFMQDASGEEYMVEYVPVPVPQGTVEVLDGQWEPLTVIWEAGDCRLLRDGVQVEVEMPGSREEAEEVGMPVFQQDGVLYFTWQIQPKEVAREDGKEMLNYWVDVRPENPSAEGEPWGEEGFYLTGEGQTQADGSVIYRASCMAEAPLEVDALNLVCEAEIYRDGETIPLDAIRVHLPVDDEARHVRLVPEGDGKGERFQILSGHITFTKVRGYYSLSYTYQPPESGEWMGIDFFFYDEQGNRIPQGGGGGYVDGDLYSLNGEMQSFEELPQVLYLEAKVIGENRTLGRVKCQVVEE